MNPIHSSLEPLEARIAPATLTGKTLTYTDGDGDDVAITISKGTLTGSMFTFDTGSVNGDNSADQQLQLIDLSTTAGVDGANITMKVTKAGGGDGLAAVGRIEGGTHDFGTVTIKGDLGKINCGSNTAGTPAIKMLQVRTMGRYGLATQVGGDLFSDINGALGKLNVSGDLQDVAINVSGGTTATLGSVKIGGSLIGGTTTGSGIDVTGDIGPVKIGGDLRGGSGLGAGTITAESGLGLVTIGGSLIGGTATASGSIFAAAAAGAIKIGGNVIGGLATSSGVIECSSTLASLRVGGSFIGGAGIHSGELHADGGVGALKIGGDLLGGTGDSSAFIDCRDTLGPVTIGGSLIGSSGQDSAEISVTGALHAVTVAGSIIGGTGGGSGGIFAGAIGTIRIGHDLQGASITTGSLSGSGEIEGDSIRSVTIGGSIRAGFDNSSTGAIVTGPSISASFNIGSITVKGDILGSVGNNGDVTNVLIFASGEASPTSSHDVAIGKITVGGTVERAQILGGYNFTTPEDGNAQIGPVKVGGNWIASDLIAGVKDGGTAGFGDGGDTIIGGGASIAKIASIMIKGVVVGTAASGDQFGFESHAFGSIKIAGTALPAPAAGNFVPLSPVTADVTVRAV